MSEHSGQQIEIMTTIWSWQTLGRDSQWRERSSGADEDAPCRAYSANGAYEMLKKMMGKGRSRETTRNMKTYVSG
jgi:hypothetical protein